MANAPRNVNRRLPSISELDSDVHGYANTLYSSSDLDLGVLMRSLVPPHLLDDTDPNAVWTFDSILRVHIFFPKLCFRYNNLNFGVFRI